MNTSLILSYITSLFSKEKVKYLIGFLFIILIAIAFSGVKSCSNERKINKDQRGMFHKNVNALKDKHQEEVIVAHSKSDQEIILKDSRIKSLMDSLGTARKNIVYYKHIALQKSSTVTITKYDTLYEFIELEGGRLLSFTQKLDNCLTIRGEFTPKGLVLTADKVTEIHDINYFKRRNLFGLKWTPRIGKKEYYQTLTTNCNDTITENRRIIFKRN